ncbi:hypothetical protein [Streptomyces yanii]|uniref:Amidohydrolase n=1 Tax=Streptomyces yanii TaxID=78510 RepID=A0ABV5RIR5_9ACTN
MSSSLARRTMLAAGAVGLVGAAAGPAAAAQRSAAHRSAAALVVHNARVFTGLPGGRPVEAVAVGRDGRILATGRGRELAVGLTAGHGWPRARTPYAESVYGHAEWTVRGAFRHAEW